MPSRLILNADDFGLTTGINRAIGELHQARALTSATLMAKGPAFNDAVSIARALPSLGVGCHIVLVDGTPVSPPREIPSLLGPDRKTFRPSLVHFVRDLYLGHIREEEIAHEAYAQVQKLQEAGIDVTHVDTHKHTHMFPRVARPLLRTISEGCGLPLRYPFEPQWSVDLSRGQAHTMRLLQLKMLRPLERAFRELLPLGATEVTTSGTLGIAATGSLDTAALHAILSGILTDHDEGILYELVCHPGYNDTDLARVPTRLRHQRDMERQALLSVIPQILAREHAPQLIHYGNLKQ